MQRFHMYFIFFTKYYFFQHLPLLSSSISLTWHTWSFFFYFLSFYFPCSRFLTTLCLYSFYSLPPNTSFYIDISISTTLSSAMFIFIWIVLLLMRCSKAILDFINKPRPMANSTFLTCVNATLTNIGWSVERLTYYRYCIWKLRKLIIKNRLGSWKNLIK